jgi:starch-binding outer membrane protein, SusD/RagB family
MRKNIIRAIILVVSFGFMVSCSDFLDPMLDGSMTEEEVFENRAYFNGLLNTVYNTVSTQYDVALESATDNAVTNNIGSDYYQLGNGYLYPRWNPLDSWTSSYLQIRRLNQFFEKLVLDPNKPGFITPVRFVPLRTVQDSINNVNTFYRIVGETYFLRAYFQFQLLQAFGGEGTNGQMLGVPIVTGILGVNDNLNFARNTYMECVQQIVNDCDSAIKYLPLEYRGANVAIGQALNGRANGIAAMALKARTLLYAASPAYNKTNNPQLWENAAIAAGNAIKAIGGLLNLATVNNYHFVQLNNGTFQIRDIFFRGAVQANNRTFEIQNYPPGMYGSGLINPSQNYVNAFPDRNGYPIEESTLYDPNNPYANRDPRLQMYVALNGTRMGPGNYYTIETFTGGADAYSPVKNTTRTGYYLKKLLRPDVVSNRPGNLAGTARANVILGTPELYLNFAEAAFEAWGPTGDPKALGFNAQQVIARILLRHGAGNAYMNTVAVNDIAKFRKLVRNERRLELSFEGHYFWDLRRWTQNMEVSALNQVVYGAQITKDAAGGLEYNLNVPLEQRKFSTPFMPISADELYKAGNLIQNQGW